MSDSAAGMDTAPQEPQSPAEVGDSENRHLAPVPNVGARKSGISVLDRLIKTCPVWLQLCMSSEKAVEILRQEAAGVFLVTRDADLDRLVLWVHVPAHTETCDVLRYNIKEEKSMRFLEGSVLVFEDIFKLVAFYCVSRDVFPSTLKLPQAIAGAQSCSDLETISNLGTGFWDLSLTDKRDLGISPPVSACGSILANSVKPAAHMSSDTNDCSCEIEISAGNDKLWFVNPIFIEEFSNARAPDKLPLVNCVANPEVKAPKVVYRRPPPPPPLQNPPLPFLPPSAPPNNYLLSSPLQSPPLSSSFSPPLPSPFPPPFLNTLPSSSPPHELLSLCSSPYVAPPPPSLPPSVHPSSTPPQALFVPPSPPISHTLETSSQLKDSSEISSIIWVDMHLAPPSCEEMKINNSEDNKGSGGDDSSLLVAQTEKPGVVPPVVPRRRQSEKLSEVNPNSLGKKEELHMKESQNSSNIPSVMTILEPRSKKQADAHLIREKATSQREEVSSPEPQCTSPGKEKRCPPVPPPRTKRLSRQFSSISTVDGKPATKKGTAQQCSRTTRAQRNCSSVQPAASGKGTDEASVKTLPSKKLKGCETSLNSPASGSGARTTNPEQDSFSNSSTEDDVERLTSPSIKKTQSFMLDRARNRLSIVSISNVFTAFMSADRKLQKRITELAQDKDSYFGNLVQDYKTYSLEMMAKQSSSTEMLQEIRMMMTQLKSYLVQSTELKSMVDFSLYTDEKIEAVVEAALCKCVLKSLKCPIESYLREIHSKDGSLRLLTENQMVIQETTSTDLGVTTSVPEISVMEKITQKFATMHKTYSPEKKITYLLKSCKLIYDSMSTGSPGKPHGADDFLPVLMYVLARCDLAALLLDVEYMMELMDPALQLGEGSYYLTTTYGALEHIKYYDKITVTRQLSVEVQDSIHRWERRRTLNKARVSRSSVQDFITISFEEPDSKTRTLVTKPDTSAALLLQECAEKFEVCEPERYGLFVLVKDRYLRLATDALPHHIKSQLLKCEQKLDFHFLYKPTGAEDIVIKELDFL